MLCNHAVTGAVLVILSLWILLAFAFCLALGLAASRSVPPIPKDQRQGRSCLDAGMAVDTDGIPGTLALPLKPAAPKSLMPGADSAAA
jgi:hypothetical protein